MEYGLIGAHLPHSFSAVIHGMIAPYTYTLQELTAEEIDGFMTGRDFRAINVTIPYKQTVIPYLDEIAPQAEAIGAVNTIVNRDGKLFGYNTDFGGMSALIRRLGLDLNGKKVLILGTGGTSKTAKAVAESLGASTVLRVSRGGNEDALTYDQAYACHSDAQILINTTPCGMFPNAGVSPVDLDRFPALEGVIDAVYNPLRTDLILCAKKKGLKAEGGLYMLVAQAVLAAEHFMDTSLPDTLIDEIFDKLSGDKENIVLTGMPGAGKTTIGRILAESLGRPLVDVDACIVAKSGMEITDIFAQFGEGRFRDMETEMIRELSAKNGLIISTGGGSPLRSENVDALKSNGTIFFLDRPLEELLPTDDRPLANSADKIRALYAQRYDIYCRTADVILPVAGTPEQTAQQIESRYSK